MIHQRFISLLIHYISRVESTELLGLTTFYAFYVCCRSEEHTSELQSQSNLVCRLLLEKKKIHFSYSFPDLQQEYYHRVRPEAYHPGFWVIFYARPHMRQKP